MARFVIAEDQLYLRNLLTMWMTRSGHEVVSVPDGRSGLECLQAQPADLLITDIQMPRMNGVELVRLALASCPTLRRVFVVTSVCDPNEILRQLPDPRVRVFSKPFSPSQLLREVELVVPTQDGPRAAGAAAPGMGGPAPMGGGS